MRALAALPSASDFGGTGFLQASADAARFNVEAWQGAPRHFDPDSCGDGHLLVIRIMSNPVLPAGLPANGAVLLVSDPMHKACKHCQTSRRPVARLSVKTALSSLYLASTRCEGLR